jgi:hypothetical protein
MSVMTATVRLLILLCCLWPALAPAQSEAWEEADTEDFFDFESLQDAPDAIPAPDAYKQENISLRELDREAWHKATSGLDYSRNKEIKEPTLPEPPKVWNVRGVLKVLAILIAAVALFFLIRSLLGLKTPRNRKLKTSYLLGLSLEQIEERFQELELEDYIEQAIAGGDYTAAVRLYYMAALKELSARELIHWKKDKTNLGYLRELRGSPLLPAFQEITYIYELVWYGLRRIDRQDFERIEPKMKQFVENSRTQAPGGPKVNEELSS